LTRIGDVGAHDVYDQRRHAFAGAAQPPPREVRVQARGVARGAEVLVKARVGPIRRKKRP
jgi:hypothetical protein